MAPYCQQLRCRDVKGLSREGVRTKEQAARGDVDSRANDNFCLPELREGYGKRPQKGLGWNRQALHFGCGVTWDSYQMHDITVNSDQFLHTAVDIRCYADLSPVVPSSA